MIQLSSCNRTHSWNKSPTTIMMSCLLLLPRDKKFKSLPRMIPPLNHIQIHPLRAVGHCVTLAIIYTIQSGGIVSIKMKSKIRICLTCVMPMYCKCLGGNIRRVSWIMSSTITMHHHQWPIMMLAWKRVVSPSAIQCSQNAEVSTSK